MTATLSRAAIIAFARSPAALTIALLSSTAAPSPAQEDTTRGLSQRTADAMPQRPLEFVPNRGQWAPAARFQAARRSERVWVVDDGFWVAAETAADLGVALRFTIVGDVDAAATGARGAAEGLHETATRRHWLCGSEHHATDVPAFAQVRVAAVAAGTDLVLRDGGGHVEYDLELAPGADAHDLRIRVQGHDRLRLAPDGSLWIDTAIGTLRQTPPRSFATAANGTRTPVASRFVLHGDDTFGFAVDAPPDAALTIDPGLVWGSFLGGSLDDRCEGLALDSSGRVAVAGTTVSTDLPSTPGSYRPTAVGNRDAFVAVFDATGQNLVYLTYLGGLGDESVGSIRALSGNRIAVGGWTNSTNFPVTANRYQPTNNGGFDGFATVLAAGGGALDHSTYYGGTGDQTDVRLWVATNGDLYLAGKTSGTVPLSTIRFQGTRNGQNDVFLGVLDRSSAASTTLRYGTYYGGSGDESQVSSIHVDANGIVTIGVTTNSSDCVTTLGFNYQATYPGGTTAGFILCLQPSAPNNSAALVYASYFGDPSGSTQRLIVEQDTAGFFSVVATTSGTNWPASPAAFQPAYGGGASDVLVMRVNGGVVGNPAIMMLTYLGGSGDETAHAFHLNFVQNVTELTTIVGSTTSTDFPVRTAALQAAPCGFDRSGFVAQVDTRLAGANQLVYGSYFDGCTTGSSDDELRGVQRAANGQIAVAGVTAAATAPGTYGSFRTTNAGAVEGVVAVLDTIAQPPLFSTFGAGCGATGFVPALVGGLPPRMSQLFTCDVTNARPGTVGFMAMGLSNTAHGTLPLPLNLAPLGMPGCSQLVSVDATFLMIATGPTVPFGFLTPASMNYYGVDLFLQFVMLDPAANAFGAALSNGARLNLQY